MCASQGLQVIGSGSCAATAIVTAQSGKDLRERNYAHEEQKTSETRGGEGGEGEIEPGFLLLRQGESVGHIASAQSGWGSRDAIASEHEERTGGEGKGGG